MRWRYGAVRQRQTRREAGAQSLWACLRVGQAAGLPNGGGVSDIPMDDPTLTRWKEWGTHGKGHRLRRYGSWDGRCGWEGVARRDGDTRHPRRYGPGAQGHEVHAQGLHNIG